MVDNNLIIPDFDRGRDDILRITLERNNQLPGVLDVFLVGRIDNYNSSFFQEKLELISKSNFKKILFHCSSLEYVSSSGFGVFANYFPKFKQKGGTFVFIDLQTRVFEVFQLLGFDRLFSIAADRGDLPRLFDDKFLKPESVFPKLFSCPICNAKLKAVKAGKFRCSSCKVVISVNESGTVTF